MAIGELTHVVTPPTDPVEAVDNGAWERAQQVLGTTLPSDFREFGRRYGSGTFCGGYLWVANPLSRAFDDFVNYGLQTARHNSKRYPYQVFPDQPGLLPWGSDESGHMLHWLTEGDPDSWPIIVESHEREIERFEMSMSTFLARAFTNEIRPQYIWGEPFRREELVFVPKPLR